MPGLKANYDALAAEYYDASRHPTSAALRSLSIRLLRNAVVAHLETRPERVVELGAGASSLTAAGVRTRHAVLVDASLEMLRYSEGTPSRSHVRASASMLPIADAAADLVIAPLGDPYNDQACWSEVARILRPRALAVLTAPAYEWATWFRALEGSDDSAALFAAADGSMIETGSYVYDAASQSSIFAEAGLTIVSVDTILREAAGAEVKNAPKLASAPPEMPLVASFVARAL